MSIFVAKVISACLASSDPWSQVSDFRRCSGSVLMVANRPSRTAVALWSSGRWTSITYRVCRSTKVAMAERQFDPKDQIPLPMSGNGAVGDLGRSLADQNHVRDLAPFRDRGPSGASDCTAGTQVSVQVSAQMTAALDVQRLVDRLGTHPHLRPFGKPLGEVEADLLRAPLHTQPRLHHGRQFGVVELAGLRPATPQLGLLLRRVRRVLPGPSRRRGGAVAAKLTTDRRGRAGDPDGDRPNACPAQVQVGDL